MSRRVWLQLSGCPGEGVLVHSAGSAGLWQICQEGVDFLRGGGRLRQAGGKGLCLGKDRGSFCLSLWRELARGTCLCQALEGYGGRWKAGHCAKELADLWSRHAQAPYPSRRGAVLRALEGPVKGSAGF